MLPRHLNNTFIIVVIYSFAQKCPVLRWFSGIYKMCSRLSAWQNTAEWSNLLLPVSNKFDSKRKWLTTKLIYHFNKLSYQSLSQQRSNDFNVCANFPCILPLYIFITTHSVVFAAIPSSNAIVPRKYCSLIIFFCPSL